MLIRYLDGGVNLIRLNSRPINWYQDCARLSSARSSQRLDWYLGDETFGWQAGAAPLYWFAGPVLNGTVSGNALEVTGLPPSTLVARPAEFVRLFPMLDGASALVSQVVTEASSDANGVAVLRLFDAVPDGVYPRVNIGDSDSRVFKATDISRPMQTARGNWFYEWTFREVFAHEVGGFNEVNPWD